MQNMDFIPWIVQNGAQFFIGKLPATHPVILLSHNIVEKTIVWHGRCFRVDYSQSVLWCGHIELGMGEHFEVVHGDIRMCHGVPFSVTHDCASASLSGCVLPVSDFLNRTLMLP